MRDVLRKTTYSGFVSEAVFPIAFCTQHMVYLAAHSAEGLWKMFVYIIFRRDCFLRNKNQWYLKKYFKWKKMQQTKQEKSFTEIKQVSVEGTSE